MIDEDDGGGGIGGAAAILGQFGLGGGGGGKYNLDKIVELAKSRRIIQKVLLDTVDIEGKEDLLANHFIDIYEYHKIWSTDTLLQNFYFIQDTILTTDRTSNSIIKSLKSKVTGDSKADVQGIMKLKYDKGTKIFDLSCESPVEILSITLVNSIYRELSDFYIKETIKKSKETFKLLESRADSALIALNAAEYQLAYIGDRSSGILMRKDRLKQERLSRKVQILTLMYGEILKNKETSEFLLKTKTPFFQIVDEPIAPIDASSSSKIKAILMGGFLGVLLSIIFFLGRKIYRDTMRTN